MHGNIDLWYMNRSWKVIPSKNSGINWMKLKWNAAKKKDAVTTEMEVVVYFFRHENTTPLKIISSIIGATITADIANTAKLVQSEESANV